MDSTAPIAPAGIAVRLLSTGYESVLCAAIAMVVGFVLLPWVGTSAAPTADSRIPLPLPGARALSLACLCVVFGAWYAWLWSDGRASLPMRTWRLRLVTATGEAPGIGRAGLRYLAWWIGPLCALAVFLALRASGGGRWALALLGVNYAWALIDRDRQFLHDRLAGTRLVRTARRKRGEDREARQDL